MKIVWIIAIAAVSALIGAAAAKLYYDKKMEYISRMLEDFVHGKLTEYPDLSENLGSRIAFLLHQLRKEIFSVASREKEENDQVKGLISDISHQLRTPLANIRMYEELLEDSGLQAEERRHFLENIREEAIKSEWLLKNLVNASRLESGAIQFQAEPEYLKGTLAEAVREVYHLAKERDISVVLEEFEDRKVLQNRRWTRVVFVNILENALKYSMPGSEIRISVKRQVSYIQISFRDQGAGIPKEEQKRIFERFYRCGNVKEETGSGLGLYLARLILLKESGSIMVESEEGSGSIFNVFLKYA